MQGCEQYVALLLVYWAPLRIAGRVWTPVGLSLPFTITEFVPGRRWAWTVAGVPATAHEVESRRGGISGAVRGAVVGDAYLPVCAVALGRIERAGVG